jgi:hypothetical protein
MSRPGIEHRASTMGGDSIKEPFEQLVNSNSDHLHMREQPVENARDNNNKKFTFFIRLPLSRRPLLLGLEQVEMVDSAGLPSYELTVNIQ